jgi:hypothetical protein
MRKGKDTLYKKFVLKVLQCHFKLAYRQTGEWSD